MKQCITISGFGIEGGREGIIHFSDFYVKKINFVKSIVKFKFRTSKTAIKKKLKKNPLNWVETHSKVGKCHQFTASTR